MSTGTDWYKRFRNGIEFVDKKGKPVDKNKFITDKTKRSKNGPKKFGK